jgi:hypothetical protein
MAGFPRAEKGDGQSLTGIKARRLPARKDRAKQEELSCVEPHLR